MTLSNIRIGRKIALALGGVVLLLACLSVLSLWGLRIGQRLTEDTISRLTASQLADTIAGEQANISIDMGKMVLARNVSEGLLRESTDYQKSRNEAVERFKAQSDRPESIAQAAELADIALKRTAANESIVAALRAGQYAEAARLYELPLGKLSLRAKAREASKFR